MTSTASSQPSNAMRLLYLSISIASVVFVAVSVVVSNRNNTWNYRPYTAPVPSPSPSRAPTPGAVWAPVPSVPCKLRRLTRRRVPRPSHTWPSHTWPSQTRPSQTRPSHTRPEPSTRGCVDESNDDPGDSDDLLLPRRPRRTRRPISTNPPRPTPVNPPFVVFPHVIRPSITPPFVAMSMLDGWSNPFFVPDEIDDPALSMSMPDGDFGHEFIRRGEFINPSTSDDDEGVSTISIRTTNDITSSQWDEYIDDVGFD